MKQVYFLILFTFLSLNALGMQIFVSTPSGKTITIEVETSYTIIQVKNEIEMAEGFPMDNQILKFNDEILENGSTVGDYNIQAEDTIYLTLLTLGITDLEINNSQFKIYPIPSSNYVTISGLKTKENFKIYNIQGKCIKSGNISNLGKVDITSVKSGLYFLKFKNERTIKFIKE